MAATSKRANAQQQKSFIGKPSVSHGSMYDALKIEGYDSDEEEEEEDDNAKVVVSQITEAPPAPLSKSARKRLSRQNLKQSSSSASSSTPSTPPIQPEESSQKPSSINIPKNNHLDAPVPALAASTPEVEALQEMGVQNDGTGPSAGGRGNPSKESPSTLSLGEILHEPAVMDKAASVKEKVKAEVQNRLPSSLKPSLSKEEAADAASRSAAKGFHPTNLPASLPTLKPAGPTTPQKRHQPSDFVSSELKEKKSVRFESSVVGQGESAEDAEKRIESEKARKKKIRDAGVRTGSTLAMIAGFFGFLFMGHPYMIVLVEICSTLVYKEVTALFGLSDSGSKKPGQEGGDKWSKTLNWYFFAVANYFFYGESIIYYFKHIVFVDSLFAVFARNHRFVSFMLYVIGFVGFVANLQKPYLNQQFALFCWVHMSLLVIVVSSHFIVNNIVEGMIWFFLPATLVICNDIWAYICGMTFGKTPLIKLSPKKTVEGFVGAFVCTVIFAVFWSTFLMRFDYMICPAKDLGSSAFSGMTCDPNPVFLWRKATLPVELDGWLRDHLGFSFPTISYVPFQIHAVVMACFASLFAPFGGFFASGFKRAFNIKDFGHSIPGHGGMTDRMDCQFLMGMFSYVYYSSLIRVNTATPASILQTVASMSVEQQVEVVRTLGAYLQSKGIRY
ncbi:phosphatidate cytidylyltransferase [Phaffia rhodozyma]|uniref:Phosphatidate cytidylyltransferase n=1 Tax=Phaffia rhodozyma TaxID=264483 RepID=A0A0F7SGJ0_PHARH|nr:phosphatidate cytidylyltransferase [Phaffia rhodozyma]